MHIYIYINTFIRRRKPLRLTYIRNKIIWVCLFTDVDIFGCSKLCVFKVLVCQPMYGITPRYSMFYVTSFPRELNMHIYIYIYIKKAHIYIYARAYLYS